MSADAHEFDARPRVCVAGPLVLALVMGPLEHAPVPGEEQIAPTASLNPGGSANRAVALARLGLDAELLCSIGVDEAGAIVRRMLTANGVDLDHAARVPHRAITAALGYEGDRALTTFGDLSVPPLAGMREAPHALVAELGVLGENLETLEAWRRRGSVAPLPGAAEDSDRTWVLAECRWDTTGRWADSDLDPLERVDVFTLNETEALRYTRKADARAAARQLIWRAPGVVVTRGAAGVLAIVGDEEISLPAAPAKTIDTTSAGHAFSAVLVCARMRGLEARAAVSMAMLAAARSTEKMGSFADAPTLSELQAWTRTCEVPEGYDLAFLDLEDPTAAEPAERADPGSPDDDPRDDSGFEVASDIADELATAEVEIRRRAIERRA